MSAKHTPQRSSDCQLCSYYIFDDEYDCYMCAVNMDEDETARLMSDAHYVCPYYRLDDEYAIAAKQ